MKISIRKASDEDWLTVSTVITELLRELSGNKDRELEDSRRVYRDLIERPGLGGIAARHADYRRRRGT